jgi:hypothetical protein
MRDRLLILAGLLLFVALLTWPSWQGLLVREAASAPTPAVRAGLTHCIRDTEWMRRHHMQLLMHTRDAVVYRGIRDPNETLPGCMNCHLTRLADGSYPTVSSPQFFCNSCHSYAGVETDCFSCHSNRPDPATGGTP